MHNIGKNVVLYKLHFMSYKNFTTTISSLFSGKFAFFASLASILGLVFLFIADIALENWNGWTLVLFKRVATHPNTRYKQARELA